MTKRVLIVDDDPTIRLLASKIVNKSGFEFRAVEDGLQALEAIVYEQFDLILMDVRMPIMNGIEATRWIRGIEQDIEGTKRIPILGYSAHSNSLECMEAGMDGFMTKPALMAHVQEQLNRWLG